MKKSIRIFLLLCLFSTNLFSDEVKVKQEQNIDWVVDLDLAFKKAKKENKNIYVDFYTEWCGPCQIMNQTTFNDPKVIQALKERLAVKIDCDKQTKVANQYKIQAYPTSILFNAQGQILKVQRGMLDANKFMTFIQQGEQQSQILVDLQQKAHEKPDDFEAQLKYAEQLSAMQQWEKSFSIYQKLSKTEVGSKIWERAQVALVRYYEVKENSKKSIEILQELNRHSQKPETQNFVLNKLPLMLYQESLMYWRSHEDTKAIKGLDEILKDYSETQAGHAAMVFRNYISEFEKLREKIKENPGDYLLKLECGEMAIGLERPQIASELYQSVLISKDKLSPHVRAPALIGLATSYVHLKQSKKAEETLRPLLNSEDMHYQSQAQALLPQIMMNQYMELNEATPEKLTDEESKVLKQIIKEFPESREAFQAETLLKP